MKRIITVMLCIMFLLLSGCASMMVNTKFVDAFQSGKIYVGMNKQELINEIGYPPEGKSRPDMFYARAVQTKVTSEGTEELWGYDFGIAPDLSGIRCITFKIVNGKVEEWYERVDTSR